MNIFVGNLSFDTTEEDLKKVFEGYGSVSSVAIVKDKKGVKSRGFGFIEMPNEKEAQAAMEALNGNEFMGRALNISPARSQEPAVNKEGGDDYRFVDEEDRGRESDSQNFNRQASGRRGHRFNRGFQRGSAYKQGRRSRNFMSRRSEGGIDEQGRSERRFEKRSQARTWYKKTEGESSSWQRRGSGESRMWGSSRGESPRPWERRNSREPRTWGSSRGESPRPWQRRAGGESKPWQRRSEGESRTWAGDRSESHPWQKRTESQPSPWRKTEGESKSWRRSRQRPQESRFTGRKKFGGYNR